MYLSRLIVFLHALISCCFEEFIQKVDKSCTYVCDKRYLCRDNCVPYLINQYNQL